MSRSRQRDPAPGALEDDGGHGQTYTWDATKSASPTSLNFANTCLDTAGSRSQTVEIRSRGPAGPTSSGATTITTEVTAINPAHRTITVQATDKIYEGAGQTTLLDEMPGAAVDVPAQTSMVVLTHSFVYNGSATSFNDVATATYTDKLTGIAVPGATQATASATAQPAGRARVVGRRQRHRVDHRDRPGLLNSGSVGRRLHRRLCRRHVDDRPRRVVHRDEQRIGHVRQDRDRRPAPHHERHAVRHGHDHRRWPERPRHRERERRHHDGCPGHAPDQQDHSRRVAAQRRVGDLRLRRHRAERASSTMRRSRATSATR